MRQKTPEIHANTKPILRIHSYLKSKVRQKDPEIHENTNPVLRILFLNQK